MELEDRIKKEKLGRTLVTNGLRAAYTGCTFNFEESRGKYDATDLDVTATTANGRYVYSCEIKVRNHDRDGYKSALLEVKKYNRIMLDKCRKPDRHFRYINYWVNDGVMDIYDLDEDFSDKKIVNIKCQKSDEDRGNKIGKPCYLLNYKDARKTIYLNG